MSLMTRIQSRGDIVQTGAEAKAPSAAETKHRFQDQSSVDKTSETTIDIEARKSVTSEKSAKEGSDSTFTPAPHLAEGSVVEYELNTALSLQAAMQDALKKLKHKTSKERVHKSRVSLRRWFSVWSLLEEEGWSTEEFNRDHIAPLKKLLKAMGQLRDTDVALENAHKLECSESFIKRLKRQRKKKQKKLAALLDEIAPIEITDSISTYLHRQAEQMGKVSKCTPYEVLDEHLRLQEKKVKALARKAATAEALHKTRLGIKKWRYLLTECMGLTNFDLVTAQTLLGELHDLDRLELILRKHDEPSATFKRLRIARAELFRGWTGIRESLPYGLRPGISTLKA